MRCQGAVEHSTTSALSIIEGGHERARRLCFSGVGRQRRGTTFQIIASAGSSELSRPVAVKRQYRKNEQQGTQRQDPVNARSCWAAVPRHRLDARRGTSWPTRKENSWCRPFETPWSAIRFSESCLCPLSNVDSMLDRRAKAQPPRRPHLVGKHPYQLSSITYAVVRPPRGEGSFHNPQGPSRFPRRPGRPWAGDRASRCHNGRNLRDHLP